MSRFAARLRMAAGHKQPSGGNEGDYGVVGGRPAVAAPPDGSTTGPLSEPTQSMTGPAALAAVLAATPGPDGFRTLAGVHVTGGMTLSTAAHSGLRFDNCVFEGGLYAVNSFFGTSTVPAVWNEFRNCELRGASSAGLVGGYARLLRCDLHRCADTLKPFLGLEVWASWCHDLWQTAESHNDCIQIVAGAANSVIHYNTLASFPAPESPMPGTTSGVLQTGSVTADIGPVVFRGNWIDGAAYALQPIPGAGGPYAVGYTFRDNRFGRGSLYGPHASLGMADFDSSNVWDDTGLPVLG